MLEACVLADVGVLRVRGDGGANLIEGLERSVRDISGAKGLLAAARIQEDIVVDLASGSVRRRVPAPSRDLASIAITPDGSTFAVADDRSLTLHSVEGNLQLACGLRPAPHRRVQFAGAGRFVHVGERTVYDREAGGWLDGLSRAFTSKLVVDKKQSHLFFLTAFGSLYTADLRADARAVDRPPDFSGDAPKTVLHQGRADSQVWAVAVSPDAHWIATGEHHGRVQLFSSQAFKPTRELQRSGDICWRIAFSPDSKRVAVGDGHDIQIYALDQPAALATLRGHERLVVGLAWAPGGDRLISTGLDGRVVIWDVSRKTIEERLDLDGTGARDVAFSPDGRQLALALASGAVSLYAVSETSPALALIRSVPAHSTDAYAVAFDPTGRCVASGGADGLVVLHRVADGERLAALPAQAKRAFRVLLNGTVGCWRGLATARVPQPSTSRRFDHVLRRRAWTGRLRVRPVPGEFAAQTRLKGRESSANRSFATAQRLRDLGLLHTVQAQFNHGALFLVERGEECPNLGLERGDLVLRAWSLGCREVACRLNWAVPANIAPLSLMEAHALAHLGECNRTQQTPKRVFVGE